MFCYTHKRQLGTSENKAISHSPSGDVCMPFLGFSCPAWLLYSCGGCAAGGGPGWGAAAAGAPPVLDVPGNAGKSSDDIVNSDCSDVGCFTIPTANRKPNELNGSNC